MLYHLQSYNNKQNENDSDRVVIEAIYLDDCIVSTTTEEELSKLKTTFPDFLYTTELILRTSAYDNIQESSQHPSSGFINTTSILEETIAPRQYRFILGVKSIWLLNGYLMKLSVMKTGQ